MKKGNLIAFEGIDGSGKSTQMELLAKRLEREGIRYYATAEPTGSLIGALIRQILSGRMKADNRVIAGLFVADRLDHLLNEVDGVAAKIDAGINVVMDRYYFSSYAYQGVDVPMEWVIAANEQSRAILKPGITVFIDISPEEAVERIARNRVHVELFEEKSRLRKVRDNYLRAFELLKGEENYVIIDGSQPMEAVADRVWSEVRGFFGRGGL